MAAGRFVLLRRTGAPVGVDAGNWLAMGHALLGDSVRSSSIAYPPVVPVLVALATWMLGPQHGIAVLAAASSLAPAVGAYVVLRRAAPGWVAPLLAGLLAVGGATGEADAWGGYPQLLGFGLALVFLDRLDCALETGDRRPLLHAGLLFALVLATSHFAGLLAVTAALVMAVHHRRRLRNVGRAWLLLVVPCLPLVPIYVAMAIGLRRAPPSATLAPSDVVAAVEALYRDFRWFWRPAVLLALLTPLVRRPPGSDERLRRLVTSLVVATVLLTLLTRERRQLHALAPAAVLAVGVWAGAIRAPALRRATVAVAAVILAAQAAVAVPYFADQRDYYAVLRPGTVAGLAWIEDHTPGGTLVAVSPAADDWPLNWWVEGLARRPTIGAAGFRWLNFPDERRRARIANGIFLGSFPDRDSLARAAAAGAAYLFVSKAWSGYTAAGEAALRRERPEAFVLENDAVVILTTMR